MDTVGPNDRVVGERPISREELASTGNLIEGETPGARQLLNAPWAPTYPLSAYGGAGEGAGYGGLSSAPAYQPVRSYGVPVSGSRALFDVLDRNHDGVLTRDEYMQGLSHAPVAIF